MIKISIIVPVYNVGKYLEKCLDSILNQSLSDIEVICIDDCSTDNSLEILKSYESKDARIKILVQDKNQGQGVARNRALDFASGEYVMFCDPDDWISDGALDLAYNQISQNKNEVVFFNHYFFYDKNGKIVENKDRLIGFADVITKAHINLIQINKRWINACWVWGQIYSREFLNKHNIRFSTERFAEDLLFFTKAALSATDISVLDKPLYYYRIKPSKVSIAYTESYKDVISSKKKAYEVIKKSPFAQDYFKAFVPYFVNSDLYWLKTFSRRNPRVSKLMYDEVRAQFYSYNEEFDMKNMLDTYSYNEFCAVLDCGFVKYKFIKLLQGLFSYKITSTHIILTILGIKLQKRK